MKFKIGDIIFSELKTGAWWLILITDIKKDRHKEFCLDSCEKELNLISSWWENALYNDKGFWKKVVKIL